MTRTVLELSDRLDLADLVTAYATGVDTRDFDALDRVFTADAQVSFAASGGPVDSWPAIRAWLAETLPIFSSTQHLVSNLQVQLESETASGRCMCFNPMELPEGILPGESGTHVMFYGLWYALDFVRTDSGWRISRLTQELAYRHNVPQL